MWKTLATRGSAAPGCQGPEASGIVIEEEEERGADAQIYC
jgi:hypothetical protein